MSQEGGCVEFAYISVVREALYDNLGVDVAHNIIFNRQCSPRFSEVATFFNFAKASVGSGSFALPWGILQCGVLLGSAGMILLGIVR